MSGFTIPDSGNINSSSPVMRQQSTVTPMTDTRVEQIDLDPVADSIGNLGKAYKQYVDSENLAFGQQMNNDYNEHIAKYEIDWKNSHKGYAARDFYQALKDESWKFFNDRTGGPKDDGKIRTNDPDQKAAFQEYIDKRQPDLISRAMAYESSEFTAAQNSTIEASLTNAASRVVSASSPVEIANALADIDRTVEIQTRGYDPDYTRLQKGQQRDLAVSARVMQKLSTDPVGAALMIDRGRMPDGRPIGDENVYNNLTSGSETKLRQAIKESAESKFKADTLNNEPPTEQDIMLTMGATNSVQARMIRDDIINEAKKEKATIDAESANVRASMITDMRNNVMNAKSPEEEFQAMTKFADLYPQEAVDFQKTNNLIKQDDRAAAIIDKYGLEDLEYIEVPNRIFSEKEQEAIDLYDSLKEPGMEVPSSKLGLYKAGEILAKERDAIRDAELNNAAQDARFQNSSMEGIDNTDIALIQEYKQRSVERVNNSGIITEAFVRVAEGGNISSDELLKFDPRTAHRLIQRMNDVKDYNAMASELRLTGIDLDKKIVDTSYADFKNQPAKQAIIKGNLTKYMREYKKSNGYYPADEQLQAFINRAISNAKTGADIINDKLQKRTTNAEFQRQVLLGNTGGKISATSFDKRLEFNKKAIRETIDESDIDQHNKALLKKDIDKIAEALLTSNTATLQILTDLMGDY